MKIKISILYFLLILVTLSISMFLEKSKESDIKQEIDKATVLTQTTYNSVFNTYKFAAQKDYYDLMTTQEALEKLKEFKFSSDEKRKAVIRGELYRLFIKKYEYLKTLNVRQFHIHTHKSESLLRFHLPHENGDSLLSIRESVRLANTLLKPVFKFEGGRVFPGFRYVFPIIYNNEHLGSVEYSISFDAIEKMLKVTNLYYAYQLHLDKHISYDRVFKGYKGFFEESIFGNEHYIENRLLSKVSDKITTDTLINKINLNLKKSESFDGLFNKYDNFSLPVFFENSAYIVSFISIKDTTNQHAAYLLSYLRDDNLLNILEKYNSFYILMFLAIFAIAILIYIVLNQISKIVRQKNLLEKSNSTLQSLMNQQENIIVLTNGKEISFANEKFFNFFDFKNLKEYSKKYKCVYENFLDLDNHFTIKNEITKKNWIKHLKKLSQDKRIVTMRDKNLKLHNFSVNINKSDNNLYILNFTDISDTVREHKKLRLKVVKDKLTGAYNREYFEQNYQLLIDKAEEKNHKLAVSIIDIDFFKKINDTFGHDVGDSVLIEMVDIINSRSRSSDKLVRWGGEEFVLLLDLENESTLFDILEHLRNCIDKYNFTVVGKITCSFGASIYKDKEDISKTIKRADNALYKAKNSGRNQVIIFST